MNKFKRKLDNTAKVFSLEERKNKNMFRLSASMKDKVVSEVLKKAVDQTLDMYPSFKVKMKNGFAWNYFEENNKKAIVEKESGMPCEYLNFKKNNGYLFKVTYFENKINLDMFHVLTDGLGASTFFKGIICNYLNLQYHLENESDFFLKNDDNKDYYLEKVQKHLKCKGSGKKTYLINEEYNVLNNKTYHFVIDLDKFKAICKANNVSISEYLTAIYIYAIYKTIYNKKSQKEIAVTVPIDLRKHYEVESFSNFFTIMKIDGNVANNKKIVFPSLLKTVHDEFRNKLTFDNIKRYLARDVRLGTNGFYNPAPLFIKKAFFKCFGKLINAGATTTLSNIGPIKLEEKYQKFVDNIYCLVNAGKFQKIKCTICSYKNKLNVVLNSNLLNNNLEKEFYQLLIKYIGAVKLENSLI